MSNTFAVIKTGGKQYKVAEGQRLKLEKLLLEESEKVIFDDVLMTVEGDNVRIGQPKVEGAKIVAKVVKQGRARKIIILKYRPKKRYKKKQGHRQPFTEVEIKEIISAGA